MHRTCDCAGARATAAIARAAAGGDGNPKRNYAPDAPIDILHLTLEVTPDFQTRTVQGVTQIRFTPRGLPLDQLRLDAEHLTISRIESDTPIASHATSDTDIVIRFASPIPVGKETSVTLHHAAEPKKGLYFRTEAMGYPKGDDHCFSQGEPIEARHWFPCFDAPNEKFTSELICHIPTGMTALSNGRLVSQTTNTTSGKTRVHWLQDKPHVNYLITLCAGYFKKLEDRHGNIPLAFYTPPSEYPQAASSFQDTREMMEFFEQEIGVPYPWAKYDQICVHDFVAGGMENTSQTTLTVRTLFDAASENILSSQGLVAHELAHQWFGDLVTCKDWSHLWLNEGFATYYDALFEEKKHGRDAMLYQMFENASAVLSQTTDTTPIVDREFKDPMDQFSFRAYPKGAWILHMLRDQLGADLYRRCIKTYLERHAHGIVVTENLNAILEELSGRSFDPFFDQYVYHAGVPQLDVQYSWDERLKLAKLNVRQTQKLSKDVLLFTVPLTVRFKVNGETIDHTITIRDTAADFHFNLKAAPSIVRLDPNYALLARIQFQPPTPLLHAQLQDPSDTIGRIIAITQLANHQDQETIRKLKTRLNQDPFFGVRLEAAEALGRIRSAEAIDALFNSTHQTDARVRRKVISILAGLFDRRVPTLVEKLLLTEKNPEILAAALPGLADLTSTNSLTSLRSLLARESYGDTIKIAAIRSLQKQHDPAALPDLLDLLNSPASSSLRTRLQTTSLLALATLGRHTTNHRDQVLKTLSSFLDSPRREVRSTAIRSLGELGDPRARATVEKFHAPEPTTDEARAARESLKKLDGSDQPATELRTLRNEILTLKEAQRKSEQSLNDLRQKLEATSTTPAKASPRRKTTSSR